MTMLGCNRLRMKLNAFDRQRPMTQAHDFAIIGPGSDFKTFAQRGSFYRQRAVTRGAETTWHVCEHTGRGVLYRRNLAVHQRLGTDDLSAKRLPDRLMTEAYAENRYSLGKALQQSQRNARFVRRTRAGRNTDPLGCKLFDLIKCDLVVARDPHILTKLAKILDEVVGEAVVVIDHQ